MTYLRQSGAHVWRGGGGGGGGCILKLDLKFEIKTGKSRIINLVLREYVVWHL